MEKERDKVSEIIKKYNIDIEKLKKEQEKLAKLLSIKDSIDFSTISKIGAVENNFFKNKILSGIILVSGDEIIEQKYSLQTVTFPYISGFRAYRELSAMVECFNKLEEKPELVLIHGHGIAHDRLGLASHFSLSTGIPSIGIAEKMLEGEIKGENIIKQGKVVGKVISLKQGSTPLYVSPGNLIDVETAAEIVKSLIKQGHKLPEPMRKAKKYIRETRKELFE